MAKSFEDEDVGCSIFLMIIGIPLIFYLFQNDYQQSVIFEEQCAKQGGVTIEDRCIKKDAIIQGVKP